MHGRTHGEAKQHRNGGEYGCVARATGDDDVGLRLQGANKGVDTHLRDDVGRPVDIVLGQRVTGPERPHATATYRRLDGLGVDVGVDHGHAKAQAIFPGDTPDHLQRRVQMGRGARRPGRSDDERYPGPEGSVQNPAQIADRALFRRGQSAGAQIIRTHVDGAHVASDDVGLARQPGLERRRRDAVAELARGRQHALVASVALSLPSLRVSGDYLVIASIGFQLGLLQIIKNVDWTGGPGGLSNIPPLFAAVGWLSTTAYVAIVLLCALGVILFVRWLVSGDYGRAITAMRDDEEAFEVLGRNAVAMKVALFAIGSSFAGLAGGLYAHYFLFVTPEQYDILYSAAMLTMVVVGGLGTVWGPAVGAALLEALPQALNFLQLPSSVMAPLQGIMFTGLVLFFLFTRPQGLMGKREKPAAPAAADDEVSLEPT